MDHARNAPSDTYAEPLLKRLTDGGQLDALSARRALQASQQTRTPIERTLLEFGLVEEDALYGALAAELGLTQAKAEDFEQDVVQGLQLPIEYLKRVEAVPIRIIGETVEIAVAGPSQRDVVAAIAYHAGLSGRMVLAGPTAIRQMQEILGLDDTRTEVHETTDSDVQRLRALANEGPVIQEVNALIARAANERASDIHFEAEPGGLRVRFRIDGALRIAARVPAARQAAVTSRLKIMAGLNISEKRLPQDGRAELPVRGRTIDIRLSTLPTQYGESVVLRLLDRNRVQLDWTALGFSAPRIAEIEKIISMPNGIFLVAGPTGSGKTTTLYTALSKINTDDRKVLTVEDPIEYSLAGVNQVQVEPDIGLTFASALRAILRQDPDVLMIGEIRDQETAEIAVRSALVGRLVLSTVHTNDALSAVDRLINLGVQPYLLAATLRGVLSQRLVRKICTECEGAGCASCDQTGRKGRIVVSELLRVTSALAAVISDHGGVRSLSEVADKAGFVPIRTELEQLIDRGSVAAADALRAVEGQEE
jgi:general secretion pathway protein E